MSEHKYNLNDPKTENYILTTYAPLIRDIMLRGKTLLWSDAYENFRKFLDQLWVDDLDEIQEKRKRKTILKFDEDGVDLGYNVRIPLNEFTEKLATLKNRDDYYITMSKDSTIDQFIPDPEQTYKTRMWHKIAALRLLISQEDKNIRHETRKQMRLETKKKKFQELAAELGYDVQDFEAPKIELG